MSVKLFLGFMHPTTRCLRYAAAANIHSSSYLKSHLIATNQFSSMGKLDFEEFKKTKVKSFKDFKISPAIDDLYKNDPQKLAKAYEAYCRCQYTHYCVEQHEGNPGTMT